MFKFIHSAFLSTMLITAAATAAQLTDPDPRVVGPELVVNGSFENCTPDFTGDWYTFSAPSHDIAAWTVGLKDVDIHQFPGFQVPHGKRYVDLNGFNCGSVRQQIMTEPGATYLVRFYMTTNPDGGTEPRPMYVRAAGQTKNWAPKTISGATRQNSQWHSYSWEFVAKDRSTIIEFGSLVPTNNFGAMIDNVSVKKLDSSIKPIATTPSPASKPADPFADFSSVGARLQESLRNAASRKFIDVKPDTEFQPDAPVTRAEFIKFLVRIRQLPEVKPDSPTYTDVPSTDPNYKFIETATKHRLVVPVEDDDQPLFKPELNVTRQDLAEMYCTFAGKQETAQKLSDEQITKDLRFSTISGEGESSFKDLNTVSDANKRWIAYANRAGVLTQAFDVDPSGKTDEQKLLRPDKPVTRAEAVHILMKLYGE